MSITVMTMDDVMTPQPVTIGREQSLAMAHAMMQKHKIHHLPVLEHGEIVGVVSERDLFFLETIAGIDLNIDHVDDAMSVDVYAVAPSDTVQSVAATMSKRKYGCAVVMERGRVIGIFTATDALRLLSSKAKAKPAKASKTKAKATRPKGARA